MLSCGIQLIVNMILKSSADAEEAKRISGKRPCSLDENFILEVEFVDSRAAPAAVSVIAFRIWPPVQIDADEWMIDSDFVQNATF